MTERFGRRWRAAPRRGGGSSSSKQRAPLHLLRGKKCRAAARCPRPRRRAIATRCARPSARSCASTRRCGSEGRAPSRARGAPRHKTAQIQAHPSPAGARAARTRPRSGSRCGLAALGARWGRPCAARARGAARGAARAPRGCASLESALGENGRETLRSGCAQGTNPITAAWITKGDGYKHPSELVALEPRVSARGYRIPALCVRKIRSCAGRVRARRAGARRRRPARPIPRCGACCARV